MAKDGGMEGGFGMSPRKAMGNGKVASGADGVERYSDGRSETMHPDARSDLGRKSEMKDHERGIGDSVTHSKGMMPAQAAPDHGPTHPGGHMADWKREGKA
jgi:hypothetical protein